MILINEFQTKKVYFYLQPTIVNPKYLFKFTSNDTNEETLMISPNTSQFSNYQSFTFSNNSTLPNGSVFFKFDFLLPPIVPLSSGLRVEYWPPGPFGNPLEYFDASVFLNTPFWLYFHDTETLMNIPNLVMGPKRLIKFYGAFGGPPFTELLYSNMTQQEKDLFDGFLDYMANLKGGFSLIPGTYDYEIYQTQYDTLNVASASGNPLEIGLMTVKQSPTASNFIWKEEVVNNYVYYNPQSPTPPGLTGV